MEFGAHVLRVLLIHSLINMLKSSGLFQDQCMIRLADWIACSPLNPAICAHAELHTDFSPLAFHWTSNVLGDGVGGSILRSPLGKMTSPAYKGKVWTVTSDTSRIEIIWGDQWVSHGWIYVHYVFRFSEIIFRFGSGEKTSVSFYLSVLSFKITPKD